MIIPKTAEQIKNYRDTGRIAAEVLTELIQHVKVGVSTYEIAKIAEDLIVNKHNAIASCIGQYDFEYALCSSVNDVVCHGVPSKDEILKDGDTVNLDVTVKKHGLVSDTSRMYLVGNVSDEAKRLSDVAQQCLYKGIKQVKPGNTLGDIGFAVHKHATRNGYSIVREYSGHGIGAEMHEAPEVLHYGKKGKGVKLVEGMTFTIEPMVNQGKQEIEHLDDEWTVVTQDGKLSVQWEHTILVTKDGFEILTLRDEEDFK
ncbi:MAG: methionyl aminopeptidase [Bacteriovoracaceae bacterium]|jgi:methionyl aminopeptidase